MGIRKCAAGHYFNEDKTPVCPYCAEQGNDLPAWPLTGEEEKSSFLGMQRHAKEPVTGWLVCTAGPDWGKGYSLYKGYHSVGCTKECDIEISGIPEMWGKIFTYLVYEERKNEFILLPEENMVVCLNGKPVMRPARLTSGDSIQIKNCEYELVAYCKGDKKWPQARGSHREIH